MTRPRDRYGMDWTMPLGNPQRTNSLTLRGSGSGPRGLILFLSETLWGGDDSDRAAITCRAYDFSGREMWRFDKDTDHYTQYMIRVHSGNVFLVDPKGYSSAVEIDMTTGKEIGSTNVPPGFVWQGISVSTKNGKINLSEYPSGREVFSREFVCDYYDSGDYLGLLGVVDGKAVFDFEQKFVIIDLGNPDGFVQKAKERPEGNVFKLVNMDENGIVGVHHSADAATRMDEETFTGKDENEFSSLVYLGYDGSLAGEPFEFGMQVFPNRMAMLEGRVYLEIGQARFGEGGSYESASMYCFDLSQGRDVWSRKNGRDAVPTPELVYLDGAAVAVNGEGGTEWEVEKLDPEPFGMTEYDFHDGKREGKLRLQGRSISADFVVRHLSGARPGNQFAKEHYIRMIDRFTGKEVGLWRIEDPYADRSSIPKDMICVDFLR